MERFQIYLKEKNKNVHTYSITRINEETNTYKLIDDNLNFCQISFGDKKIAVNNIDKIKEYLDLFNFLEICQISKNEYAYIKDINEYVSLRKILYDKCKDINSDKLQKVIDNLLNGNPYEVFESFEFFDEYIERL